MLRWGKGTSLKQKEEGAFEILKGEKLFSASSFCLKSTFSYTEIVLPWVTRTLNTLMTTLSDSESTYLIPKQCTF